MCTVFAAADELTQNLAVFKTYPNTMNQSLVRLSLYILMSGKNKEALLQR